MPLGKALLSLCPMGKQYHQLAMEYMTSGLAILFEVECPQAESALIVPQGSSVSPVRYEISSPVDWPYCSIMSAPGAESTLIVPQGNSASSVGHQIVQTRMAPGKSQLSLCPRGVCYHPLAMKYYHELVIVKC